ncbi:hypothetical protein CDV55_106651 [Aspergillus turcosus]|uniref:Trafficking protein particle complex subunit n=1 Tax=Aspergillus turcosus TaxID=1245748 RepID=A0A229XHG1_9EURO|nr:hypothetical protein CDV55_106651 [Aspergillus turcosus]RLL99364.1 hypothetical protein CFD26_106774 [Aspergillus turcosus]
MVVYSFYIFDRHAECIYKRRWLPRPASIVGKSSRPTSEVATQNGVPSVFGQSARTTDDDAKLIFGTVFSLRNMVRKLGGEDDSFVTYRTSQYKLHYYETPTNIKFVMLTDVKSPSMRVALQQIYINLYVEYVVKNPLSPVEHPGGVGVNNELFEESLEQFVHNEAQADRHLLPCAIISIETATPAVLSPSSLRAEDLYTKLEPTGDASIAAVTTHILPVDDLTYV